MFLPTTRDELNSLKWDRPDIILVTGDSYIDSPFIGIAVIGKVLSDAGYRVAVIAQPDVHSEKDIKRLGEPLLFWGVSGGSIDSMIANYTSLKKRRKSDDYTPGGINNRRPDRATIVYTNLIKQHFKNTKPILLGGIEASLRRIAHYDYWSDSLRSSILFDSKADYLLYGMADKSVLQFADAIKNGDDAKNIRGLCYIAGKTDDIPEDYLELPSYDIVKTDNKALINMFHTFYKNNDPLNAQGLYQKHGTRYLVHNPPALPLTQEELDKVYALDFERSQHPYYERQGKVKALETIRFSISTHRGCYGECNFCAITVHEGRTVQWRSQKSILTEVEKIASLPDFKGYIVDVGGPTANMYGYECSKKLKTGSCTDKRCLYPQICQSLKVNHNPQIELLRKIRRVPGVKKVFVASGIRYDLLLNDKQYGKDYLEELVKYHISGQMKIAPEHTEDNVLQKMGKPGKTLLLQFKDLFEKINRRAKKEQFLTYYLIAAHPGCTLNDMNSLKRFAGRELKTNPEQVQIFCPAPSTYSALMYYTQTDPFTGKKLFVEKDPRRKEQQKDIVVKKSDKG
ncbi:MAG: YgiQ family radical SAM protein [Dehalococcoidales bacterium]|nr:YgiQ family radical SAM protein [Dehalococcoidales bacterium]